MRKREDIIRYYEQEKNHRAVIIKGLALSRKRISALRAILFILPLVLLFTSPSGYNIFVLICFWVVFIYFVDKDLKIKKKHDDINAEYEAIEKELNFLKNGIFEFENGEEFANKSHNYFFDLDIVGHRSVFQYINRTITKFGRLALYKWLKSPAGIDEILLRQESIKELSLLPELIISFISKRSKKKKIIDIGNLINQMQKIIFSRWKKNATLVLSILNASMLGLFIVDLIAFYYFFLFLLFSYFVVYGLLWNNHFVFHEKFKRCSQEFLQFADLLRFVEQNEFNSTKLKKIKSANVASLHLLSTQFKKLAKINKRLDYRLNIAFHILVNTFIYYDVYQIELLNSWFKTNKNYIEPCFNALGEFETLMSFANLYHNNPEWSFPQPSNEKNKCVFQNVGHPLIPYNGRVTNDFSLNNGFSIITGSNMAGKSTFLRTIGINIVLGLAGAPVCAQRAIIPVINVITLMRTSDSLVDNVSSFQAELNRVKKILNLSKNEKQTLVILDEPLKGTNSTDRYFGVKALIYQLIEYEVIGILATHDLRLTEISKELPLKISNYYFDITMENNQLDFDYKLKSGVCKTSNAKYLLEELGLKVSILD